MISLDRSLYWVYLQRRFAVQLDCGPMHKSVSSGKPLVVVNRQKCSYIDQIKSFLTMLLCIVLLLSSECGIDDIDSSLLKFYTTNFWKFPAELFRKSTAIFSEKVRNNSAGNFRTPNPTNRLVFWLNG